MALLNNNRVIHMQQSSMKQQNYSGWKIWKSMGTIIPYIMENKKIQTTNQYCLSKENGIWATSMGILMGFN